MPAIVILSVFLGSALALLAGGGSTDPARLTQEQVAERVFQGILGAHGQLQQNFAMTGRFEGTPAWPARDTSASPVDTRAGAFGNFRALAPGQGGASVSSPQASGAGALSSPSQVSEDSTRATAAGAFPGLAAALICSPSRASEGTDTGAFTTCAVGEVARGHRYLVVLVPTIPNAAGSIGVASTRTFGCTGATAEQSRLTWELLARKRAPWAQRLNTDVWLRGYASTDLTPTGWQTAACPQLWIYLGRNTL